MIEPRLKAIVACSPEGIIAIGGKMPWHVREDLQRFKRLTINNVVIYGRKTFESLGRKCLPDRENFVVSRSKSITLVKGTWAHCYLDLDTAIQDALMKYPDKTIWICGGANIYRQMLPIVDELELTIIKEHEVKYDAEGDKLFLPGYKDKILDLFTLKSEYETESACYQTYKRRVSNISSKVTRYFPSEKP